MKTLVELNKIENKVAYVTDTKSDNQYQVFLSDDQLSVYQSMLDEAKEEELEDESAGVLLPFNTDTEEIVIVDDESELF